MRATGFTHVSIHSTDVEESAAFYESLFGVERVPAPNFGSPTVWLRIGDLQLHLFERDVAPPEIHHFGLVVDDFDEFYRRAKERGLLLDEDEPPGSGVYELPDGSVQTYIRDPGGNLVEVDYPDASDQSPEIADRLVKREEQFEQSEENLEATLFVTDRDGPS
jgi:catechol 2,3-dioxygenase-like lactoylglutathione lyase family enzyme